VKGKADKRTMREQGGDAAEVGRAYDRWAASYDADRNATRDLDAAVVRSVPFVLDGRDVLELGCGTGKNTPWLAGRAKTVIGLDFSIVRSGVPPDVDGSGGQRTPPLRRSLREVAWGGSTSRGAPSPHTGDS
jgi:hypothetical protein